MRSRDIIFFEKTGRFIEREKRRRRRRMWLVDLDLLMKSSHLSSRSGRDFWSKFKAVTPIEIRGVQKDFRSKFLGEFAQELEKSGYIERFNRTLEEEFIEYRESGC